MVVRQALVRAPVADQAVGSPKDSRSCAWPCLRKSKEAVDRQRSGRQAKKRSTGESQPVKRAVDGISNGTLVFLLKLQRQCGKHEVPYSKEPSRSHRRHYRDAVSAGLG